MWKRLGALAFMAAIMPSDAAEACLIANARTAVIHNIVPADLDPRLIVAEVDILTLNPERLHSTGGAAEIRRMIQGPKDEDFMVLRVSDTSCSHPFLNGRSGIVVGMPIGRENGILVLDALEVSALSGYRLREGYRVPDRLPEVEGAQNARQ
jgi:hypothetical protein